MAVVAELSSLRLLFHGPQFKFHLIGCLHLKVLQGVTCAVIWTSVPGNPNSQRSCVRKCSILV